MPGRGRKIRLACPNLAMRLITHGGIAVFDLLLLEHQLHEGMAISDLNNAVRGMRSQEKNHLFLYGDRMPWLNPCKWPRKPRKPRKR